MVAPLARAGGAPRQIDIVVAAAVIGAYMAMNIGANDVANNVGPAVGSKALTMGGAIVIAAIFEAGGAIIAGGDVVKTIKKGITPQQVVDAVNMCIRTGVTPFASFILGLPGETPETIKESMDFGEKLKKLGWEACLLGIESGSNKILKNMNKATKTEWYTKGIALLKKYDIKTFSAIIIGYPGETLETIQETIDFITKFTNYSVEN